MTRYQLKHSAREHIADGVVHVLGVVFAVAAVSALIVWASLSVPTGRVWPLAIYSLGLITSFSLSAAYNLTLHAPTRAILRRFDHAAIYLLIAATYTPMALNGMGGTWGWVLTGAVWLLATIGMVMKLGFFHRSERSGFILYLAMGWLGVLAAWPLFTTLSLPALVLIVIGGLTYTLGTLFYQIERIPFSRAIWHSHVLAAAATHYAAVILVTHP
ncbi:MAG: hemolysin III family protein [Rhodobacteraceae bacterium]|nr:hemolysin III family protein [Paracoccaceae bacterium]